MVLLGKSDQMSLRECGGGGLPNEAPSAGAEREPRALEGPLNDAMTAISRQLDHLERCLGDLRASSGPQPDRETAAARMMAAFELIERAAGEFEDAVGSAQVALASIDTVAGAEASGAVAAFMSEFRLAVGSILRQTRRGPRRATGMIGVGRREPGVEAWTPLAGRK